MYDMSSKFNTFYSSHVVLSQENQTELYRKKDINIQRLKDGLEDYNKENRTSYDIVESCVQGSVAMSTVVQCEDKSYDIDVAIVFNKADLGDKGAQATRNMVADALKRKTKQFNAEPEVKTSCVRVVYAEGYHIDYAIYRREWDKWNNCWVYEHAGSEWSVRDLKGLTEWFKKQNDYYDDKLRMVVRLSKMFCNSRDSWVNMPSGLLQTVICDEQIKAQYSRNDEVFFYTMKAIVDRLELDTSVTAPVDNGRDLTPRKSDIKKMTNWKNRLKSQLEDLEVLFSEDCSQDDALQAWYGFFKHDYWKDQSSATSSIATSGNAYVQSYRDTEQFIEDMYPINEIYKCRVTSHISGDGLNSVPLTKYLSDYSRYVPQNLRIRCVMAQTDCPGSYDVLWKVKNSGPEAERRNMIRGQIEDRGKAIEEPTCFFGNHYIECYIIKNGVCVAKTRINVPIGRR